MSQAAVLADTISPVLNSKVKETFADYKNKQNKTADSLEETAVHLFDIAKHCNKVSDECVVISKELKIFSDTEIPDAKETMVN